MANAATQAPATSTANAATPAPAATSATTTTPAAPATSAPAAAAATPGAPGTAAAKPADGHALAGLAVPKKIYRTGRLESAERDLILKAYEQAKGEQQTSPLIEQKIWARWTSSDSPSSR